MERIRTLVAVTMLLASPGGAAADVALEFLGASSATLGNPHDLKLSPDGRHLLVSDVDNDRIAILDPETLAFIGSFGEDHQGGTHDVDFDADGRVYVADTHNNRVTVYEMDGTRAMLVGELGEGIRGPEGVLAHPNGRIYVAGAWSDNLVVYKNGVKVDEMDGLSSPHDVELAPGGNIWLSDAGNHRMLLLSPALDILSVWQGEPFRFNGVRYQDVLDDGTVIAADKYTHSVKFIAADGTLLHVLGNGSPGRGPGVFTTPEGVEVEDDILWLSDSGNDRVVKYRFTLVP